MARALRNPTGASDKPERPKRVRQPRFSARQKLLSAAYLVLSRKGLEGATIVEIVQEAGVGVGSFYNHFSGKEDLAEAVFVDQVETLGQRLGQMAAASPDAAIAACYIYRTLIDLTHREPLWGAFITQIEAVMPLMDKHLRKHARAGMEKGVAEGRLRIDDIDAALTLFHASCIAVMRAYLNKDMTLKAAHGTVAYALRMFGISVEEANDLASWPMSRLLQALR